MQIQRSLWESCPPGTSRPRGTEPSVYAPTVLGLPGGGKAGSAAQALPSAGAGWRRRPAPSGPETQPAPGLGAAAGPLKQGAPELSFGCLYPALIFPSGFMTQENRGADLRPARSEGLGRQQQRTPQPRAGPAPPTGPSWARWPSTGRTPSCPPHGQCRSHALAWLPAPRGAPHRCSLPPRGLCAQRGARSSTPRVMCKGGKVKPPRSAYSRAGTPRRCCGSVPGCTVKQVKRSFWFPGAYKRHVSTTVSHLHL